MHLKLRHLFKEETHYFRLRFVFSVMFLYSFIKHICCFIKPTFRETQIGFELSVNALIYHFFGLDLRHRHFEHILSFYNITLLYMYPLLEGYQYIRITSNVCLSSKANGLTFTILGRKHFLKTIQVCKIEQSLFFKER